MSSRSARTFRMLAGDRSSPDFLASVREPTGSPVATYSVTQWYSTWRARGLSSGMGDPGHPVYRGIAPLAFGMLELGGYARGMPCILHARATAAARCAFLVGALASLPILAISQPARAGFGLPPALRPVPATLHLESRDGTSPPP